MTGTCRGTPLAAALGALKANADVVAAVGFCGRRSGDATAVRTQALWEAIDGSVSGLITELLGDSTGMGRRSASASRLSSALLGGGLWVTSWVPGRRYVVRTVPVNPVVSGALVDACGFAVRRLFGAQVFIAAVVDG